MVSTSSAWITAEGRTLQNCAIFAAAFGRHFAVATAEQDIRLDTDRLQFLDRMLGRLVFNSPAAGIQGTKVRCTNIERSGPTSLPNWRMASRNGRLSISPTVPPISHEDEIFVRDVGLDPILDSHRSHAE